MDLSSNGANTRLQDISSTGAFHGRRSEEARSPQTPRLQKKRSNPGTNPAYRRQTTAPITSAPHDSIGGGDGTKARKGSLRNAVRRLFSRRSREPEQTATPISPPRHAYHRSEPTAFPPQPRVPEGIAEEEEITQRILSAPMIIPPAVQRTRSPYAVEFPQSARLKPINLGDPFSAPGSQLRRRKTLPSMLASDSDAEAVSTSIKSQEQPGVSSFEASRDPPAHEIGKALTTSRSEKRRSRSLGDLGGTDIGTQKLPRKRSEDIRYWRESLQDPVLRASGFRVPSVSSGGAQQVREEDRTPIAVPFDPFENRGVPSKTSPSSRRGLDVPQADYGSPSALGTELSQDLEDRVAKLEAGLQNFQGELAQLAAERNRRTVMIGGVPRRRRASSGGRTASMLADTLQSDLEPSSYQYDYRDTLRPSTSPQPPQPPRTPVRFADPSVAVPAIPVLDPGVDDPFISPPPVPVATAASAGTRNESGQSQPPQHTFRSLYEMLSDERSARRRLEQQMRNLRDEIANLHYQVSLQSNVQSQRSSYYANIDPMVGSSRLHALLRDTEDSRPGTAQSQQQRGSGALRLSTEQAPVVSRFSGSESEAGEPEDLQTPYDAYQTPTEERGSFPFTEQSRGQGGMF